MTYKAKLYHVIFIILEQFSSPAYSKFGTDCPLTQSYIDISKQKYFIDKSLLLQEIFENYGFSYFYITAPKGFGKTTIANMIHFFAQAELNSTNQLKHYKHTVPYKFFINRKISRAKKIIEKHLSRYQVIRLDLRVNISRDENITKRRLLEQISNQIQECYQKYKWMLPIIKRKKNRYFDYEEAEMMINYIERAMSGRLFVDEATNGLNVLSGIVHIRFRKPVIVIIDNYDFLIEQITGRSGIVEAVYTFIDNLIFETFETGAENIFLGFIFSVSGLPIGKINQVEIPNFEDIDLEYTKDLGRQRIHRCAFLEDHIFTPYLGFTETDLMVLNRKYISNETEKKNIKGNCNGYKSTTNISFYNSFLVTKYFIDKIKSPNFTQVSKKDRNGFINCFIEKEKIREKIIELILHDELNLSIEKMYKNPVYLSELLEPNSKTGTSDQINQIFTYLFEQGYFTHSLKPDYISIPNLEMKKYLLEQLQVNYEEMKIDVKQCSEIIENILDCEGDDTTLLEMKLKQLLNEEFKKFKESSNIPKVLEYQVIAYTAAFNSKYRSSGELIPKKRTCDNEGAQVLLVNSPKRRAMMVEIRKESGRVENLVEYNLPNVTQMKYLTINVHENVPTVNMCEVKYDIE